MPNSSQGDLDAFPASGLGFNLEVAAGLCRASQTEHHWCQECFDMSRRAFEVTPERRKKVHFLAGCGTPHDDIAKVVGCSAKTLRKRFPRELDCAAIEANAQVAGYLFGNAKAGNFQAQKFWLEHRAGWRVPSECRKPLPKPKLVQPPRPLQIAGVIRSGSDAKL